MTLTKRPPVKKVLGVSLTVARGRGSCRSSSSCAGSRAVLRSWRPVQKPTDESNLGGEQGEQHPPGQHLAKVQCLLPAARQPEAQSNRTEFNQIPVAKNPAFNPFAVNQGARFSPNDEGETISGPKFNA